MYILFFKIIISLPPPPPPPPPPPRRCHHYCHHYCHHCCHQTNHFLFALHTTKQEVKALVSIKKKMDTTTSYAGALLPPLLYTTLAIISCIGCCSYLSKQKKMKNKIQKLNDFEKNQKVQNCPAQILPKLQQKTYCFDTAFIF